MMNLQELQTIKGYKPPVKVIMLNNNGYLSIRQTQEAYFSDIIFCIGPEDRVSLPDFVALGDALKISSIKVESIDNWMNSTTHTLLNNQAPALIEIMLDPSQSLSPKLASKKLSDGTMVSPALEDMTPFLEKEEMKSNMISDD